MFYFILKITISAGLIVAVKEVSKKSELLSGVFASVPLISFIAIIILYFESGDIKSFSKLTSTIFWLVLPSLIFFITFPLHLKLKINFWFSMVISSSIMFGAYYLIVKLLSYCGIKL